MIRVAIADDHAIVRDGLHLLVEKAGDIEVVGEAENGEKILRLLEQREADVLLLDIAMPGLGGFDVLQQLKQRGCRTAVLVLSMYPESQHALRFLRSGAAGYLSKENTSAELVHAIRHVAQGKRYITPEVAFLLAESIGSEHRSLPHEKLSEREYQVMLQIAGGRSVSQIAEQMGLSVRTVSTYRTRVLAKMQLGSNAELTHYAIRNKLV